MTNYHSVYDEIDNIIEQIKQETFPFKEFDGDFFSWKRIELPSDFEYLIASTADLLTIDFSLINLDYADFITVCHLDPDTKTCIDGHMELLEISCAKHNISIFKNALKQLSNYHDALLYAIGDIDLINITHMAELLEDHSIFDVNLILGAHVEERMVNRCKIKVLCYISNSASQNYSNQNYNTHINLDDFEIIPKTRQAEKRKEIDIPDIFNKR